MLEVMELKLEPTRTSFQSKKITLLMAETLRQGPKDFQQRWEGSLLLTAHLREELAVHLVPKQVWSRSL